jgi:hypothetical protein
MGERAKAYTEFASVVLDEDKLKLIRQTLSGQSHFTSQRFLAQIKEKLTTKQKRTRGRPKVQRQEIN